MKQRRSWLWVGGDNREKLALALKSNTDLICFDLEDGVLMKNKQKARNQVVDALRSVDFGNKDVCVRINQVSSPFWKEDLRAVLSAGAKSIRLPKADCVETVGLLDKEIGKLESEFGLERGTTEIILIVENPIGLLHAYDMCVCSERVKGIGIGLEDFTTAMGIRRKYEVDSHELIYAKQKLAVAAKAAGVEAIDAAALLREDSDFIYENTLVSKDFGFTGRSVSEVNQVDAVNRAFSPSGEEIEWAGEILKRFLLAEQTDNMEYLYHQNKFIDKPVVEKAEHIISNAKNWGLI